MEVLELRSALMTNYDVLLLLKEKTEEGKKYKVMHRNTTDYQLLYTVEFETTQYLSETCAVNTTPEHVRLFLDAIKKFDLTHAEKIQLINHRPNSMPVLYLIIEECEARFDGDQAEEIINICLEFLPEPPAAENSAGSDEMRS